MHGPMDAKKSKNFLSPVTHSANVDKQEKLATAYRQELTYLQVTNNVHGKPHEYGNNNMEYLSFHREHGCFE